MLEFPRCWTWLDCLAFGDKGWNLSYFEGVLSVGADFGRLFPLVLGLKRLGNNLG